MKIEWNKVTWYSKILALALFIILPFAGFLLGLHCGMVRQYMADVFSKAKNVSSTTAVAQGESCVLRERFRAADQHSVRHKNRRLGKFQHCVSYRFHDG